MMIGLRQSKSGAGARSQARARAAPELRDLYAELGAFRLRLAALALLVLCAFGLLGWRLYELQVARHDAFADRADNNRTAVVPVVPERGEIFDRNGVLLASNYKSYTLEITPSQLRDPLPETIDAVARILEITPNDRRRFARLRANSRSFETLPLRKHLSDEEVARFAGQKYRFPGVEIRARWYRSYPQGAAAAHVVGYIGRINESEKDRLDQSDDAGNYRGTEYIGKLGIEASYEPVLHGTTGVEQTEISAGGRAIRPLAKQSASPGSAVRLSIDIELQKLAETLYGKHRGALVAIDPRNGEVLALVSQPSFDPGVFVDGVDQETWDELNNSPDHPLLNRALRGTYPPGSTFKPFMALAALERGLRTPEAVTLDQGSWSLAGHTFRSLHPLGRVDLYRSIVKSSNVYYYQLASEMGIDAIHDFMQPLGFGQITGIDIPGEKSGLLPSRAWKRSAYRTREQQTWYAGETISIGIGQGYNSYTALQLASATATLAAGGVRNVPHLVQARTDPETRKFVPVARAAGEDLGYNPAHVAAVLRAMVGATREGTARSSFVGASYTSGGKTGTAQAVTIRQDERYNAGALEERERDHSVYVGFAPAENPRIAVAAIVENAGFGASYAAPVVRRVMDYWLEGLVPTEEDIRLVHAGKAGAPIGSRVQARPRVAARLTALAESPVARR